LFESQDQSYRDSVLPPSVTGRVAVELAQAGLGSLFGWGGTVIGMRTFGASAPGGALLKKFGFTPEKVLRRRESRQNAARRGSHGRQRDRSAPGCDGPDDGRSGAALHAGDLRLCRRPDQAAADAFAAQHASAGLLADGFRWSPSTITSGPKRPTAPN